MTLRTLGVALLLFTSVACGAKSPTDPSQNLSVAFSQTDLVVGTGKVAAPGTRVTANYAGWLFDPSKTDNKGAQFDAGTFPFLLGAGQVIRGWDQGVAGMAVGGKRRLVIPPNLAYGSAGSGPIPPNSTLVFDIEVVNVE